MRDNSHWHPDARRTVLAALVLTGLLTALSGCGEGANGARVSGLDATATLDAGTLTDGLDDGDQAAARPRQRARLLGLR